MLRNLLCTSLLFFSGFHLMAQITFTDADYVGINDTITFSIDTLPGANISIGGAGPSQVWDFSGIQEHVFDRDIYIDPADTPVGDSFPTSNLALQNGGAINYLVKSPQQVEVIGLAAPITNPLVFEAIPFEDPLTIYGLPLTFGAQYTDTSFFSFALALPPELMLPGDSARISQYSETSAVVDAYGQVTTPLGTFDALRLRVQTEVIDITELKIPILGWTEFDRTFSTEIRYDFIAKESKGPLVQLTLDDNGNIEFAAYTLVTPASAGQGPVSKFTYGLLNANGGVRFFDLTVNQPSSWAWDFDDGNTSVLQNPVHIYADTGTYNVCLTVTNSFGTDQSCQDVRIEFAPQAAFSFTDQGSGSYQFTDESAYGPTAWRWDFGDGDSSFVQNPVHVYTEPGTYAVCLTATNAVGEDQVCEVIRIEAAPVAAFSFTDDGEGNFMFTDLSTNDPDNWLWDFGDGNTQMLQNPQHTFTASGDYTVCLTASNGAGSDSTCQQVSIMLVSNHELADGIDLVLSPNPADHQINFRLNIPLVEPARIRVFNATGQSIGEQPLSDFVQFTTTSWPGGMYYYRVENREGKLLNRGRFVISH